MGRASSQVIVAIPARWGSTRFPGKPLAELGGKPVIAHVVERALAARTVDGVVLATDHHEIAEAGRAAGADVVMTGEHPSGTDRVAEAVLGLEGWELVINVQGDEPLLDPGNIDCLVEGMMQRPEVGIATLCRPLPEKRAGDPNAVKVVRRADGRALYFSRAEIPFPRDAGTACGLWKLHLGIYGFRRAELERFVGLPPSPLERAEALEQLRALENGLEILVLDAPHDSMGIDTPEDLEVAAGRLAGKQGS